MSERAKYDHKPKMVEGELECIWADIKEHSHIEDWREVIRLKPKSLGLGYVRVTVGVKTASGAVLPITLPGIYVKILNGHPQLDMPFDKVESKVEGGESDYIPHYFPRSAAFREALGYFILADVEVQESLKRGGAMQQQAAAAPAPAVAASVPAPAMPAAAPGEAIPESLRALAANPFQS